MHRHGYKGRKFGRETDQRRSLIKSLAESLIQYESIETTLPKAKELSYYMEKLITKAKAGDLHNRRQVISGLQTTASAHKLVDSIAPQLAKRAGGYLKIEKTRLRRGDNTQLAKISFVEQLKTTQHRPATKKRAKTVKKPTVKKSKSTGTGKNVRLDKSISQKAGKQNVAGGKPTVRHTRSGER